MITMMMVVLVEMIKMMIIKKTEFFELLLFS